MSIWTMDIQYREYSMQNEYTFGCILFKNFIYLQSYVCKYNNKTITQLAKVDKCNNYEYYSNMSTY